MGRPISYDKTAVVGAALEHFWRAGFKATNIDALVAGTGLNKHSLYQALGGKAGLFVAALELYLAEYSQIYLAIFDRYSGYRALAKFLQKVVAKSDPRGCFVVNTAVELGDSNPDCQRLIAAYYNDLTHRFAVAIEQGQQAEELRAELDPRATALWLVRSVQGLSVGMRLNSLQQANAKSILTLLVNIDNSKSTRRKAAHR